MGLPESRDSHMSERSLPVAAAMPVADHVENRDLSDKNAELGQTLSVEGGGVIVLAQNHGSMKKNIGALTMIALCFNICNSWAGVAASLQIALLQGGPASLLYGMIVSTTVYMSIALTVAELASVYPTAGGQYHFASILAPKRVNRVISYICGLLTLFSWIAIGAAVMMIPSTQTLALVQFYHPTFNVHPWHYFLLYQAFGLLILAYNLFALKKNPRTHDVGFALTISLFVTIFLTILIRSSPKAENQFVWSTFINFTGWSDGVCFFTSLLTSCFMYGGLDAALHLAEEAPNPRVSVPRATVCAVGIGFLTAFPFTIGLLYSVSNFEAVTSIAGYLPFEINRQAMRSNTAPTVFLSFSIVLAFFILNAVMQTSSRITWAFARDNALQWSRVLNQIHPTLDVPVYSIILDWAILALCGCVFLASSTAFNALLASSIVLQQLSFVMPAALLMYRRRSEKYLPKHRAFALPNWLGWLVNFWTVASASFLSVFFLLPPFLPVTTNNMNYTAVILAIAAVLGIANWYLHARKHYQGPRILFHD